MADRKYLFRLKILIIDGGLLVLRNVLEQKLNVQGITLGVCLNNEKPTIRRLKSRGIITQVQYDILFPPGGRIPTSLDLDITLIICLLRGLRCFGLKRTFDWNRTPQSTDVSLEADIWRLKYYRNEICHILSTTEIDQTKLQNYWNDIELVLIRLNPPSAVNIQKRISDFESCTLDEEEEERIKKEIEKCEQYENKVDRLQEDLLRVKSDVSKMKSKVGRVKTEISGVKTEISGVKAEMSGVKTDVSEVKSEVSGVKTDVSEVKSEVSGVKTEISGVKTDVSEVKSEVSGVKTEISGVKTDVSGVKSEVSGVKADVSEVKGVVSGMENNLSGVKQELDDVKRRQDETASLLPIEILRMDKNSIELYKRALSEGKEAVYNIRVMVVGHYGVGKTTLTKRLFDEDVKINERESTNGIDVHVRRCKVSLETGEWTVSDKDQKIESASHRLVKLLKQPTFITDTNVVEKQKDDLDAKEESLDCVDVSVEVKDVVTDHTSKETSDIGSTEEDIGVSIPLPDEYIENKASAEKPKEENILYHLKELIDSLKQRSAANTDVDMADVSIWDFAGQYAFYATHQVFLSRRAVYLLVTDISKHVEDVIKDDDCFLDSKGVKHWKISEFVNFWLNSIHEFCSSPYADGPPVVLVGTFADKLNQESRQETVDDFFYTLRSSLLDKATSSHLTDDDFVVDNSIKDENIKLLKQHIVKVAQSQPNWGELVPAKWITLENIIVKLKDDGLKVLHKDKLRDLNNTLPVSIETEDELDLFLKFHHESGNILYYSDNMLSENIVLDPQWLIDAFKSLITAKMFCCRKPKIFKKWVQFDQSAILTRELVDAIWGQEENSVFQEHQELLLEYLAKLGFISKPHKQPEETGEINYYFAPCVLKTSPPEEVFVYSDYTNRRSTSVLCFTTTSGFLPTAVFNKLLASCIAKWPIAKSNKRNLIFCGCGVFDLIDNHKLYLYFFDHNINIWVTKLSTTNVEPDKYLCLKIYNFISDFLGTEIRLSSGFEVFLRCSHSDLHNNDNLFKVEDIASKQEVVCSSEPEAHVHRTDELTKYWLYSESDLQPNVLTEKELNRMAYYIGKEYQSLGIELGLTNAEIDHICLDFKTTVDRIRNILLKWKKQNRGNATVEVLSAAMKMVGIDAGTVIEKAKGHS